MLTPGMRVRITILEDDIVRTHEHWLDVDRYLQGARAELFCVDPDSSIVWLVYLDDWCDLIPVRAKWLSELSVVDQLGELV